MKAEIYTNCSLVRVPIKAGTDEYYFPQNVDWAGRKVEKILICTPTNPCTDPVDGITPVMTASDIEDCYFSLYNKNNVQIMHDVSYEQIAHTNNHPIYVNDVLNLSQCSIRFTNAPKGNFTLLLYVFYQTRQEEYFEMPKKSVTVEFPLPADAKISFQEIINTYVHALPATIKGIIAWEAVNAPAYISLRDHDLTYRMTNIHTELCRPMMNGGSADACQIAPFYTNDLDIDFDNSDIRNAKSVESVQVLTFLY